MSEILQSPRYKAANPVECASAAHERDCWITMAQLCQLLKISTSKCRYKSDPKSLRYDPSFPKRYYDQMGRSLRFSRPEANAWMANQAVSAKAFKTGLNDGCSVESSDAMAATTLPSKRPGQPEMAALQLKLQLRCMLEVADELTQMAEEIRRMYSEAAASLFQMPPTEYPT